MSLLWAEKVAVIGGCKKSIDISPANVMLPSARLAKEKCAVVKSPVSTP